MNRLVVVLVGWVVVGLEMGLKSSLSVRLGSYEAAPSFVIPLVIFIAICAPNAQALWAALGLGFVMDLVATRALGAGTVTIVGPYAIGFVLAAQLVLVIRGVVIRRNPLTLMVLSILGGLVCHIAACAMLALHRIFESTFAFSAKHELVERFLSSILTGASGLVMSLVLLPMSAWFGLANSRGMGRR